MKNKITVIAILLVTVLTFTACLDTNDNDYVYTDDSAIATFSVQSAKRYIHTENKAGGDSVYTTTVSLTAYKFVIDQQKCEIYNPDSLPYGVDATKMIISTSGVSSGSVYLKSLTSDSIRYVSSSDSLDFSEQRELQVVSMSGQAIRKYKVSVRVHQESPDSFRWVSMPSNAELAQLTATKMGTITLANGVTRILLAGSNGTTTQFFTYDDNGGWQKANPNISTSLQADTYQSVVVKGDSVYIAADGAIWRTVDGSEWKQMGTATGITRLVAANPIRLYGYNAEGKMLASADNGATWQLATLDDEASLLPLGETTYVNMPLKTNASAWRTIIIGTNTNAQNMTIWGKIDEGLKDSKEQEWNYYTPSNFNKHQAPAMEGFGAGLYGDQLLLAGKKKSGGDAFYTSRDAGLTWQEDTVLAYPHMIADKACAMTVDKDNFIWIVDAKTGNMWRGRTNKLGWKKEQNEFNE